MRSKLARRQNTLICVPTVDEFCCRNSLLVGLTCLGGSAMVRADDRTIDTTFVHSNISEDNEVQGSQAGSHR
jgi:hypothetical protein